MNARKWLRRRLAGRSLQLLADEVDFRIEKAADREVVIASYAVQLAAERERADAAERERDAWRLRARSAPLTPVGDEDATTLDKVRRDWVERTGGR